MRSGDAAGPAQPTLAMTERPGGRQAQLADKAKRSGQPPLPGAAAPL